MAKKARTVVLCVLFLVLGFVAGELLPLPFLQDVTLTATMGGRPGGRHNRQ